MVFFFILLLILLALKLKEGQEKGENKIKGSYMEVLKKKETKEGIPNFKWVK